MYQYKHASVGLREKQVTIIIPRCPFCGELMCNGRQRVTATVMELHQPQTLRPDVDPVYRPTNTFKSFEVCEKHTMTAIAMWMHRNDLKIGVMDYRQQLKSMENGRDDG